MKKPVFRWTIGNVRPDGFECLHESIRSFIKLYDAEVIICHNCQARQLGDLPNQYPCLDQWACIREAKPEPLGVAWKLYPTRYSTPDRHEVVIDNDIVLHQRLPELDYFLDHDCTLLLAGIGRTYGRFDRHVPPGYEINSGIYGLPPGFDFKSHVDNLVGEAWERNALGEHSENVTFDEQGLVAAALSIYPRCMVIPKESVPECSRQLLPGKGHHFIGLNRWQFHRPYRLYRNRQTKLFL